MYCIMMHQINLFQIFKHIENTFYRKDYKLKIYKWYAIYAWGIPFLVTLITILMQYLPKDITQNCYTPGIDGSNCLLEPKWGMLFYFHIINGPVMVIEMIIVFLDQNVLMNYFCFKRLLLSFASWKSFTFYLQNASMNWIDWD